MDHGSAGFASGQWHGYAEPRGAGKPQQPPPAGPSPGPTLPWHSSDGQQAYGADAGGAHYENGFGGHGGYQANGQQRQSGLGRWSAAEVTVGQPPQPQHDWQQPPPAPVPDDDPADDAPPPLPPPDDDAPPPLPDELPPDVPPVGPAPSDSQQQPAFLPHPSLQYAVPAEQVRALL